MTVTYSLAVSSVGLAGFGRLLLRWHGSIYKLVIKELAVFTALYYFLLIMYRTVLTGWYKEAFEHICIYFRHFVDFIPLAFVLGFYVSVIVNRWWNIYLSLPWMDRAALTVSTFVRGDDERGRLIRRNLVRYLNMMAVLTLKNVSSGVQKRFPTIQHIVDAGVMTPQEKEMLESVSNLHGNYFQPAFWFGNVVVKAREEGRIKHERHVQMMFEEMNTFRGCCGMLLSYDWISVPLGYTQVVSIAIYTFFFACLFGRQYIDSVDQKYEASKFFPLFTFIQFFFYFGWLKVAEVLINPLGEDDDDFKLNYIIDRNIQLGMTMADDLHNKNPDLVRDPFWDDAEPQIPYTVASADTKLAPYLGSTAEMITRIPFLPGKATLEP